MPGRAPQRGLVVHHHRDTVPGQVVRGPDPRQHQQLRGRAGSSGRPHNGRADI